MEREKPDRLIINSPYEEPSRYWKYNPASGLFRLEDGRRPAGYLIASDKSQRADDPGVFVEIPLVNEIRPRVKAWRAAGYPGATGITRSLSVSHSRLWRCWTSTLPCRSLSHSPSGTTRNCS